MPELESSQSMFLTDEEVHALTNRQKQPAQRRMLDALGIKDGMRADASLVVLRSTVEAVLGVGTSARGRKKTTPNWEGI